MSAQNHEELFWSQFKGWIAKHPVRTPAAAEDSAFATQVMRKVRVAGRQAAEAGPRWGMSFWQQLMAMGGVATAAILVVMLFGKTHKEINMDPTQFGPLLSMEDFENLNLGNTPEQELELLNQIVLADNDVTALQQLESGLKKDFELLLHISADDAKKLIQKNDGDDSLDDLTVIFGGET